MQRGHAVDLSDVRIGLRRQNLLDALPVGLLRGIRERHVRADGERCRVEGAKHQCQSERRGAALALCPAVTWTWTWTSNESPSERHLDSQRFEQFVELAVAVAELVQAHADLVEQREVQVGQRGGL